MKPSPQILAFRFSFLVRNTPEIYRVGAFQDYFWLTTCPNQPRPTTLSEVLTLQYAVIQDESPRIKKNLLSYTLLSKKGKGLATGVRYIGPLRIYWLWTGPVFPIGASPSTLSPARKNLFPKSWTLSRYYPTVVFALSSHFAESPYLSC